MTPSLIAAALLLLLTGDPELHASQHVFAAPGVAGNPAIAVEREARSWALVWEQENAGRREIVFAGSTDGRSFSSPRAISQKSERVSARTPAVAVDRKGIINVVWSQGFRGESGIFFTHSADGGTSFTAPRDISPERGESSSPKIAVNAEGQIFVVWADSSPGGTDILFARSTDGGRTFSPPLNLSDNKSASEYPQLALDGEGAIYVVWRDKAPPTIQIWFTRSLDGGKSFSNPKVVSRTGLSDSPEIAAEGKGTVYLTWVSNVTGNVEVFLVRSLDGGQSFGTLLNLSGTRLRSHSPSLATDGAGNVYVAWTDRTPGKDEVFLRYSPDRGESFYKSVRLSPAARAAFNPALAAIRGEGLFVVWENSADEGNGIAFVDQEEVRRAPVAE